MPTLRPKKGNRWMARVVIDGKQVACKMFPPGKKHGPEWRAAKEWEEEQRKLAEAGLLPTQMEPQPAGICGRARLRVRLGNPRLVGRRDRAGVRGGQLPGLARVAEVWVRGLSHAPQPTAPAAHPFACREPAEGARREPTPPGYDLAMSYVVIMSRQAVPLDARMMACCCR